MWDLIRLALELANIKIKTEAIKELFNITGFEEEIREDPTKARKIKGVFVSDVLERAQNISRAQPLNLLLLEKFSSLWVERCTQIQKNIEMEIPAPKECVDWEWMCLCARVTIYNDHWMDNGEETLNRGGFLPYVDGLFTLEMYLRVWRRRNKILRRGDEFEEKQPIWYTYHDLKNPSWFSVLVDDDSREDPFMNWKPAKVLKQFNTLMRDRIIGNAIFPYADATKLFNNFIHGLMDKAALVTIGKVAGLPEQLSPYNPTHFKIWNGNFKLVENVSIVPKTYQQLSKQVQEARAKDLEHQVQLLELDEEQQKKVYRTDRERLEDIFINKTTGDLSRLRRELNRLQQKRLLLLNEMNFDGYDYEGVQVGMMAEETIEDKQELHEVDKSISELTLLLQEYENRKVKEESDKFEMEHKYLNEQIKDSSKYTQNLDVLCVSGTEFVRSLMIASDHIKLWQLHPEKRISLYNIHHIELKNALFTEICKAVMFGNEHGFMANAQKWLTTRTVSFTEREEWRASYSADATFTTLDVLRSLRGDKASKIPGFTDMGEILKDPDHEHFERLLEYCGYWWLLQSMKQMNVPTTCYVHDVEMKLVCLDKEPLKSPCMTKIGIYHYIIEPGQWMSKKGWLNAWWCGTNFLDCLAAWCKMIAETDWYVYDRSQKKGYNISTTKLKLIWDEVKSREMEIELQNKNKNPSPEEDDSDVI